MKINELMIGDYATFKVGENEQKVIKITADWLHDLELGIIDFTPIPLTEEILVKNWFALDKTLAVIGTKVYTRPCPAGDLSVKVFHDGSIRFGFIKLNYVHQLQHLLRLCGIEKEIEL